MSDNTQATNLRIQLLMTGNEIMSGHTLDSNSATMAQMLENLGQSVHRKVTVGDELPLLISEISHAVLNSDVLIINGGLGPTIDDLTVEAVAKATGNDIVQHLDALNHLQSWCKDRNIEINGPNLKQSYLPHGAEVVPNPRGSAVGFYLNAGNCLVISTPGVPSEMKAMLEGPIKQLLISKLPGYQPKHTLRFKTFGVGESTFQQIVMEHFPDWPEPVELGFRAGLPLLEVKLTISHEQDQGLQKQCLEQLKQYIGHYIIGPDDTTLAESVLTAMAAKKLTLATAESCTGGLIASQITAVPGSSRVFMGGYVTYDNHMKSRVLNIDPQVIETYGAVSEPVVRAMAKAALENGNADIGLAVSGIAGPSGGTDEKPVGTVWICYGYGNDLRSHCLHIPADREWIQQFTTAIVLDLVRRLALQISEPPKYFKRYLVK